MMDPFPTHCSVCGVANENHLAEEKAGRCDNAVPPFAHLFNQVAKQLVKDPDMPKRLEIREHISEALELAYLVHGADWAKACAHVTALVPEVATCLERQLDEEITDLEEEIRSNPPPRNERLRQRIREILEARGLNFPGDDRT